MTAREEAVAVFRAMSVECDRTAAGFRDLAAQSATQREAYKSAIGDMDRGALRWRSLAERLLKEV